MSPEQLLLVVALAVALVALTVALVAITKLRAVQQSAERLELPAERLEVAHRGPPSVHPSTAIARTSDHSTIRPPDDPTQRGGVVIPPSSAQIVEATMGRPVVRVALIAHGMAHALRPESRDRIRALIRRELNSRRRARKRMARRAARVPLEPLRPHSRGYGTSSVTDQAWLGELPQSATEKSA